MTNEVFVVDRITAQPGQARAVLDAYLSGYLPNAEARGMKLLNSWISPPLGFKDGRSNTLTFTWSVDGTPGWWQMRLTAAFDPSVAAFWANVAPLIMERSRTFHQEAREHV